MQNKIKLKVIISFLAIINVSLLFAKEPEENDEKKTPKKEKAVLLKPYKNDTTPSVKKMPQKTVNSNKGKKVLGPYRTALKQAVQDIKDNKPKGYVALMNLYQKYKQTYKYLIVLQKYLNLGYSVDQTKLLEASQLAFNFKNYELTTFFSQYYHSLDTINDKNLNLMGQSLYLQGKFQAALVAFRLAVEYNQTDPSYTYFLARAYLKDSQRDKAIFYYKKTLDIDPNYRNAIYMLKQLGAYEDVVRKRQVSGSQQSQLSGTL